MGTHVLLLHALALPPVLMRAQLLPAAAHARKRVLSGAPPERGTKRTTGQGKVTVYFMWHPQPGGSLL